MENISIAVVSGLLLMSLINAATILFHDRSKEGLNGVEMLILPSVSMALFTYLLLIHYP